MHKKKTVQRDRRVLANRLAVEVSDSSLHVALGAHSAGQGRPISSGAVATQFCDGTVTTFEGGRDCSAAPEADILDI